MDSAFLLKYSVKVLGRSNVYAVIAESETYPGREVRAAVKLAKEIGTEYEVIHTDELKNKKFSGNPVNRCYYCKMELFGRLKKIAQRKIIYQSQRLQIN